MTRDWVEFDEYDGDLRGLTGEEAATLYPGLFGLGADDVGEARLQKVLGFVNSFPRPAAGQAVRADALLGALRALQPLAQKVAGLKDGSSKRGLLAKVFGPGGQGYLTSPTVTQDDKATAGRIIYEVQTRLPGLGTQPVHPEIYEQIKVAAHQLLKIGTDLGEDTTPLVDSFVRYWSSVGSAIVALPATLTAAAQGGVDALSSAAWWVIPTWAKVAGAGVIVGGGLLIYALVRAAKPYAAGYVERRTGVRPSMRGLSGIGELGRGPDGKPVVCFKARKGRTRREVCFPVRRKRRKM